MCIRGPSRVALSFTATESQTANVVWLPDGRITRVELRWDRESAFDAAGPDAAFGAAFCRGGGAARL